MATNGRRVRSDIRVGNLEKKLGLEPGSIRNPDGTDARSNKKLATLRKEFSQAKTNKVKTNPTISSKTISKATRAVNAVLGGRTTKTTASQTKVVRSTTVKAKPKTTTAQRVTKTSSRKTK
jgi:hypothetical protein